MQLKIVCLKRGDKIFSSFKTSWHKNLNKALSISIWKGKKAEDRKSNIDVKEDSSSSSTFSEFSLTQVMTRNQQ